MAKKRSVIETDTEWRETPGGRLVAQLELLAGVAEKAIMIGRAAEAERLISPAVSGFMELVYRANSVTDWEHIAHMHASLSKLLPKLEAVTGKPWMTCLEVVKLRLPTLGVPPRGQA